MIHKEEKQDTGKHHDQEKPKIRKEEIALSEMIVVPLKPVLDRAIPDTAAIEVAEAVEGLGYRGAAGCHKIDWPHRPEKQRVFKKRYEKGFDAALQIFTETLFSRFVKIAWEEKECDQDDLDCVVEIVFHRWSGKKMEEQHMYDRNSFYHVYKL